VCHSVGHLSYNCPNRHSCGNDKGRNQATSSRAQINCCITAQCMPERVESVVANQCAESIDVCASLSVSLCGSMAVSLL